MRERIFPLVLAEAQERRQREGIRKVLKSRLVRTYPMKGVEEDRLATRRSGYKRQIETLELLFTPKIKDIFGIYICKTEGAQGSKQGKFGGMERGIVPAGTG